MFGTVGTVVAPSCSGAEVDFQSVWSMRSRLFHWTWSCTASRAISQERWCRSLPKLYPLDQGAVW